MCNSTKSGHLHKCYTTFMSATGLYTKEIGIAYWCWSRYIKRFKVAVNFLQVTVTIALASSAVNGSQLNSGSDICCTYARGHIFGGLSESFLSLAAICVHFNTYIYIFYHQLARGGHSYRRCSHSCDRRQKILTIVFVA